MQNKSLRYILRPIVMLFLRAKVIPVNLQIHTNVMRPLCVCLTLFLNHYVPDIVLFLKFLPGTLINKIC
jgi:hypothetical protein